MSDSIDLMLFIVNPKTHQTLIDELKTSLDEHYPEQYTLKVIDVLSMPEKAVENQVFATPMLMRQFPEPIMKLLLNVSNIKDVLISVRADEQTSIF